MILRDRDGERTQTLGISSVAPHPTGNVFLLGCGDGRVMMVDDRVHEMVQNLWNVHVNAVQILELNPRFDDFFSKSYLIFWNKKKIWLKKMFFQESYPAVFSRRWHRLLARYENSARPSSFLRHGHLETGTNKEECDGWMAAVFGKLNSSWIQVWKKCYVLIEFDGKAANSLPFFFFQSLQQKSFFDFESWRRRYDLLVGRSRKGHRAPGEVKLGGLLYLGEWGP